MPTTRPLQKSLGARIAGAVGNTQFALCFHGLLSSVGDDWTAFPAENPVSWTCVHLTMMHAAKRHLWLII